MVEKLSAYGISVVIVFCPQAALLHLANAGTSTSFTAGQAVLWSIVSSGNLLYGITLIGGHLLTFQARGERISSYCTTAGRGFVAVVFEKAGDGSPWTEGYLMP